MLLHDILLWITNLIMQRKHTSRKFMKYSIWLMNLNQICTSVFSYIINNFALCIHIDACPIVAYTWLIIKTSWHFLAWYVMWHVAETLSESGEVWTNQLRRTRSWEFCELWLLLIILGFCASVWKFTDLLHSALKVCHWIKSWDIIYFSHQ